MEDENRLWTPPTGHRTSRWPTGSSQPPKSMASRKESILDPRTGTKRLLSALHHPNAASSQEVLLTIYDEDPEALFRAREANLIRLRQNFEDARSFDDDDIFFRNPGQTTIHDIEASIQAKKEGSKTSAGNPRINNQQTDIFNNTNQSSVKMPPHETPSKIRTDSSSVLEDWWKKQDTRSLKRGSVSRRQRGRAQDRKGARVSSAESTLDPSAKEFEPHDG